MPLAVRPVRRGRRPAATRPIPSLLHLLSAIWLVLVTATAASAAPAAAVTGRVTDPAGRPVPGARVLLSGPVAVPRTAVTGQDGRFRLAHLDAGRYELQVVREGFSAAPVAVTLAPGATREVSVRLHVSAVPESVVVTASPVETPLSRVADSVTVLTSADLRARQIDTVADALRLVPGLAVAQSGTWGQITSVFPRGGDSNYTLVLIDGMPANEFGGGFDFSQLPVSDIARIEVVRGPQSALFGSGAIGGVIQIITRHGGPPRAAVSAEGGGLGTTRYTADTSGSHGAWTWGASAERMASQGYTGLAADGERVSNDNGEERAASGSLGWGRAGGTQIRANADVSWSDIGFPGPYGSNPVGAFAGVDRISRGITNDRQVGVRIDQPWAHQRAHSTLQASYTDSTEQFVSPYGPSNTGSRRLQLRTQTDVALGARGGLSAGVDVDRERAVNTYITGATGELLPISRWLVGTFAEARYNVGDRLFLTAGLRVDDIRQGAIQASPDPFSPRPPLPESTVLSPNPKVSVAYFFRPGGTGRSTWTRLHATAGTGIRPPDAVELAFTDNPHLKPERSRSADIGIEQGFARGRVVLDATAFLNRYNDLIVAVGRSLLDFSQFATDNISNAQARGLEISGAVRVGGGLQARVAYTFLDSRVLAVNGSRDVAPPPFQVGEWLLRRPRQEGSVDLLWTRGRVTAFGDVGARGRTLDVEPTLGAFGGLFWNPGYTVVNAGATVRVGHGVALFARVANLLDRRYEEVYGYPASGRLAMVGLRVSTSR